MRGSSVGICIVICSLMLSQCADAQPVLPLTNDELAAVQQRVAEAKRVLGDKVGVPEARDKFVPIPKQGRWLTPTEARAAFTKANSEFEKARWWRPGIDPTTLEHTLREPATVLSGCVAAYVAGLDDAARSLAIAKDAADFLIWAQAQAGSGVFPFPSVRSGKSKALASAKRFLIRAERAGRLDQAIRNGWVIDDADDGGLQFDNGEAGFAMFELYEATQETKYLDAARKSADWALSRLIVANWNYNSFSVYLLAKAYSLTGEEKYLTAATRKALLGVVPGQLTEGARTGRWFDAHNAKPAYHYIMLRALATLAIAMPNTHADRPAIMKSLALGLSARNKDFVSAGAPNKDKAMEALLLVNQLSVSDREMLRDTQSAVALERLGVLVSEQYRRGVSPLGPREWGHFSAFVMARETKK